MCTHSWLIGKLMMLGSLVWKIWDRRCHNLIRITECIDDQQVIKKAKKLIIHYFFLKSTSNIMSLFLKPSSFFSCNLKTALLVNLEKYHSPHKSTHFLNCWISCFLCIDFLTIYFTPLQIVCIQQLNKIWNNKRKCSSPKVRKTLAIRINKD